MNERPETPHQGTTGRDGPGSAGGYTLRRATRTDLDAIARLEEIVYVVEGPWTLEDYVEEFTSPGRYYVVVEIDGHLVGYGGAQEPHTRESVALQSVDNDATTPEESVIRVLSVDAVTSDPAHRGRGIGRMLMNDMVHWARQQGLAGVELEVREGNVAAVGLYRSMGFAAIGRLEDFYDTGVHALQMRLMFETGC